MVTPIVSDEQITPAKIPPDSHTQLAIPELLASAHIRAQHAHLPMLRGAMSMPSSSDETF